MFNQILFDCDGVILNSNRLKTEAFYEVAIPFGEEAAFRLVEYHVSNGGVSRFQKFYYFLNEIVTKMNGREITVDMLSENFSNAIYEKLLKCQVSEGLFSLQRMFSDTPFAVVSGSSHTELNEIFKAKNLSSLFRLGVHGSPKSKYEIIESLIAQHKLHGKTLFIGDSKYDFEVAQEFQFNFAYISKWSEWKPLPQNLAMFDFVASDLYELSNRLKQWK